MNHIHSSDQRKSAYALDLGLTPANNIGWEHTSLNILRPKLNWFKIGILDSYSLMEIALGMMSKHSYSLSAWSWVGCLVSKHWFPHIQSKGNIVTCKVILKVKWDLLNIHYQAGSILTLLSLCLISCNSSLKPQNYPLISPQPNSLHIGNNLVLLIYLNKTFPTSVLSTSYGAPQIQVHEFQAIKMYIILKCNQGMWNSVRKCRIWSAINILAIHPMENYVSLGCKWIYFHFVYFVAALKQASLCHICHLALRAFTTPLSNRNFSGIFLWCLVTGGLTLRPINWSRFICGKAQQYLGVYIELNIHTLAYLFC